MNNYDARLSVTAMIEECLEENTARTVLQDTAFVDGCVAGLLQSVAEVPDQPGQPAILSDAVSIASQDYFVTLRDSLKSQFPSAFIYEA